MTINQHWYSLAELDQLVAAKEQGGSYITSQDQSSHVTARSLPSFRRDIQRDIYGAVLSAGRAVSTGEIAKLLELKKTPWLRDRIQQLVDGDYLVKTEALWRNGVIMYLYEVRR